MKKTVFLLIFILICLSKTVVASARFDEVLSDKIEEYGVFEDGSGVVYAGEKSFENRPSLLLIRAAAQIVHCFKAQHLGRKVHVEAACIVVIAAAVTEAAA